MWDADKPCCVLLLQGLMLTKGVTRTPQCSSRPRQHRGPFACNAAHRRILLHNTAGSSHLSSQEAKICGCCDAAVGVQIAAALASTKRWAAHTTAVRQKQGLLAENVMDARNWWWVLARDTTHPPRWVLSALCWAPGSWVLGAFNPHMDPHLLATTRLRPSACSQPLIGCGGRRLQAGNGLRGGLRSNGMANLGAIQGVVRTWETQNWDCDEFQRTPRACRRRCMASRAWRCAAWAGTSRRDPRRLVAVPWKLRR
jgi:hypothetical protein